MIPAKVLVYFQMAQFLMVIMVVSWVYGTFFFLPLCMIIGPTGHFGQLTYTNAKKAQKSIRRIATVKKKYTTRETKRGNKQHVAQMDGVIANQVTYFFPKYTEAYSRLPWISKTERFETIVNDFKLLTNVTKYSILDVYGSPGYDYAACFKKVLPIFVIQFLICLISRQILK